MNDTCDSGGFQLRAYTSSNSPRADSSRSGASTTSTAAPSTESNLRRRRLNVDLTRDGLLIVGPALFAFEIPHLFPDFAPLSHSVVYYAELNGVPVFIDGQPWQDLDVYQLFPFLADDPSTDAPGAAAV